MEPDKNKKSLSWEEFKKLINLFSDKDHHEEVISDEMGKELEDEVDKFKDVDDIIDFYDDHELVVIDDETGQPIEIDDEQFEKTLKENLINEVLSRSARLKAKIRFARSQSKRSRRLKVALKMRSSSAKIQQKARKAAIKLIKTKILKGRDINKISVGEKERLDKIIQISKKVVDRLATKLNSKIRQIENDRLTKKGFTK